MRNKLADKNIANTNHITKKNKNRKRTRQSNNDNENMHKEEK